MFTCSTCCSCLALLGCLAGRAGKASSPSFLKEFLLLPGASCPSFSLLKEFFLGVLGALGLGGPPLLRSDMA